MEGLQRKERIDADAVDLRLCVIQAGDLITKGAQLFLADGAERGGKKREHNGLSALSAQGHGLPLPIHQGEIRRGRSNVYSHRNAPGTAAERATTTPFECPAPGRLLPLRAFDHSNRDMLRAVLSKVERRRATHFHTLRLGFLVG